MSTARTDVGTVEDLQASAIKAVGLDDFGVDDDNYLEALGVLLESYRLDADFTELGSKMSRFFLRNALVARLLSEASWKQYPQHVDVPIEKPIFVTGLPRTGTTALHRLLCGDPRHQGLELWLAEFPQPRPPRETWPDNPVFAQLDARFKKAHDENPDYTGLHYMTADEVEECWQLLRQSLHSVSYETLAHVPTYAQWLARQDWTKSYGRHRKNLQLIGLNDPEKRWVLKNPSHLFALDALFATYPDALVIQCHRPAETIMASMCSLAQHTTDGWSNTFVGCDDRRGLAGDVVTWAGAVQCRTAQAGSGAVLRRGLFPADPRADPHGRGDLLPLRHRHDRRGTRGHHGHRRGEQEGPSRSEAHATRWPTTD